jgi:hypothetical protein
VPAALLLLKRDELRARAPELASDESARAEAS